MKEVSFMVFIFNKWVELEFDGWQAVQGWEPLRLEPNLVCPLRGGPRLALGCVTDASECYYMGPSSFSLKGLMLQDLVSAKLISDYIVVEIPDSVNDLQGTVKVKFHHFKGLLAYLLFPLLIYLEFYIGGLVGWFLRQYHVGQTSPKFTR